MTASPVSPVAAGLNNQTIETAKLVNLSAYNPIKTKLITSVAIAAIALGTVVFSGLFMTALPQTILFTFYTSLTVFSVSSLASIYFGHKIKNLSDIRSEALSAYPKMPYGKFVEMYQKTGHITEEEAISLLYKELRSTDSIFAFLKRHQGDDFLNKIHFSYRPSIADAKRQLLDEIRIKLMSSIQANGLTNFEDISFIPTELRHTHEMKALLADAIYTYFATSSFTIHPAVKDRNLSFALSKLQDLLDMKDPWSNPIGNLLAFKLFKDYEASPLKLFKDYKQTLQEKKCVFSDHFKSLLTQSTLETPIESILKDIQNVEEIFIQNLNPSHDLTQKVDTHIQLYAKNWILKQNQAFLLPMASIELQTRVDAARLYYQGKKADFETNLDLLERTLAANKRTELQKMQSSLESFKTSHGFYALEQQLQNQQAHLREAQYLYEQASATLEACLEKDRQTRSTIKQIDQIVAYFEKNPISLEIKQNQLTQLNQEISDLVFLSTLSKSIYGIQEELLSKAGSLKRLQQAKQSLEATPVVGMLGIQKRNQELQKLNDAISIAEKAASILERYEPSSFHISPQKEMALKESVKNALETEIKQMSDLGCERLSAQTKEKALTEKERLLLTITTAAQRHDLEIAKITAKANLDASSLQLSIIKSHFDPISSAVQHEQTRLEWIYQQQLSFLDQAFGHDKLHLEEILQTYLKQAIKQLRNEAAVVVLSE